MPTPALLSQGTTVQWAGVDVDNVTRITIGGGSNGEDQNGPEVSIAHLGSCHCKEEPFLKTWAPPSDNGANNNNIIQIDFMGASAFEKDQVANFSVSGQASFTYNNCTCVAVQQTAQVGDVLRGSATIRFA